MMKVLQVVLILLAGSGLHAAECTRAGQSIASEGWSAALRRVCFTDSIKENVFLSPDHKKAVIADANGFTLRIEGKDVAWPVGRELSPSGSEVSWSATSSAFFISYGDGSGLDGWTINVFSLQNSHVIDHKQINERVVRAFREEIKCAKDAVNPNVRGLGWSRDGTELFLFAQTTVSEPCGVQGNFRGAVISLANDCISKFYSEAEAKNRLHDLLPYNMR
jgi:hypothetical protein